MLRKPDEGVTRHDGHDEMEVERLKILMTKTAKATRMIIIGALIISIGLGGILYYYNYNKEPPKTCNY